MSIAVVYYSAQGNCALAAKALAHKLGARLVELVESKPRTLKPMGFMKAGFQASVGIRAKLAGEPWQEVADCGELYLVTPIWASRQVPAMNRFLEACDFSGKVVTILTVQADPAANAEKAWQAMSAIVEKKGGKVKAVHGYTGAAPGKGVKAELAQEVVASSQ